MTAQAETGETPLETGALRDMLVDETPPYRPTRREPSISPQTCPTCGLPGGADGDAEPRGDAKISYVYAVGRIESRFPNLAAEKEFAQIVSRTDTAGLTDGESFHAVLSKRENRYLVRQLCWVLSIQGMETYLLMPRDPMDLDLLVEAIRPNPKPGDIDVVLGVRGPVAPPTMCNGLLAPIVLFDQIYSFGQEELVKSIPRPDKVKVAEFEAAAEELFRRIMQLTDNAGATEADIALNYLAMRYPAIYSKASEEFSRDFSLTSVDVRPAPLAWTRNLVDVIFSYTNRNTDFTEKFFVRVDVTEEFPFLVTKLSPFYDRDVLPRGDR